VNNNFSNIKKVIPTTYLIAVASIIIALIVNHFLIPSLLLGFTFSLFAHTRKMKAMNSGKPSYFTKVSWTNYLLLMVLLILSFYKQEALNPFVVLFAAYTTNFVFLLSVIGRAITDGRNRNS